MLEYIPRDAASGVTQFEKLPGFFDSVYDGLLPRLRRAQERYIASIPAADVVDKAAYDQLLAENAKLKKQVSDLRYKIYSMKDDSWDEDYRRGQVQGMW